VSEAGPAAAPQATTPVARKIDSVG